jgi:signal transduction histidine kinase
MRTAFARRRVRLLPIVLALAGAGDVQSALAATPQKQVLVLYSVRRDAQIARIGDRELPRILGENLAEGVDLYSEYLDIPRFQDPEYRTAFRDFLLLKYKGHRFDLLIAMSPSAAEFIAGNRRELFPGTPVVFFQIAPTANHLTNATGIIAEPDISGTIDLARTLQPETRNVFVVAGAAQDSADGLLDLARRQIRSLDPSIAVTYLSGLATEELEARLAALPRHSIVLYISVNRDAVGQYFNPLAYTDRIASVANAPTYSWVDSTIGHGVVGGRVKVQEMETAAIAKLALRVLRGEAADRIPPVVVNLNAAQLDWRQMQRWGIDEARIPAGTVLRFREPGVWDRYRNYILGAASLLLAQSGLIGLLLVQARRRRQAEEQVRGSQKKLLASHEQIRDLGGRLLRAQEAERCRIARELHDDVGQQLALLAIDLELVDGAGPDLEGETGTLISESLGRTRSIARSVHDLSHRLHPEKLHLLGLVAALESMQREFSRPSLVLTFAHQDVPESLPPDVTLCLFRIVQEALQNIIKHSSAREVSIELAGHDAGLVLTIADDGKGFESERVSNTGLGLVSMEERLQDIGGSLNIWSRAGEGTRLEITVPHERLLTIPIPRAPQSYTQSVDKMASGGRRSNDES